MNDKGRKQIDFKFAKNWKSFTAWYDAFVAKAKCAPRWEDQVEKIEECFDSTNPEIVDWKILWKEFTSWYKAVSNEKEMIVWAEQKRQIETLMLGQLGELNKDQFILVYLYKGKPQVGEDVMTYWEAVHTKENLEGDSNGVGGDERIDKINIVNLSKLIK